MSVNTYFVYCLVDPIEPNVVRYVGQTRHLERRYRQHVDDFGYTTTIARFWTRALSLFGRTPELHVLNVVHGTLSDSMQSEESFIRKNSRRLLNKRIFVSSCARAGIKCQTFQGYLDGLRSIFELIEVGSGEPGLLVNLGSIVDGLELACPSLRLLTEEDSWRKALLEISQQSSFAFSAS